MLQNISAIGEQFLANLAALQSQIATTQEQVSSGVKINQPSDNPAEVGDVLELESRLGNVNQVISNLGQVTGEVNTASTALDSATQLMDQVTSLGTQGANSTATAAERSDLSSQVQNILSQFVSLSQTQYDGMYVFNGDSTTTPPYQLDLSSPTGVDQSPGTAATRLIQDATGVTFADSLSAQQIFDARNPDNSVSPNNVFSAVNSLRVALANNDQTGITNAMASLSQASGYLSQQQAYYGGVQDEITNATDVAQKFQLQDQTALGQLRDTNVASAAISLTQEQTEMQASLQAEAATPKTSLFDFLSSTTG
jgi:flagellar hook-associated protein 3 FlgL